MGGGLRRPGLGAAIRAMTSSSASCWRCSRRAVRASDDMRALTLPLGGFAPSVIDESLVSDGEGAATSSKSPSGELAAGARRAAARAIVLAGSGVAQCAGC